MTASRFRGLILLPFRVLLFPFRLLFRMLRSFRFWLLVVILLLIVLIGYYIWSDRDTPLTADAYLQAYVVQVAPQVAGQVVRVHVAEGDSVAQGDPLFELDPRPFEHRVAVLEARLALANQQVKQLASQLAARHAEHQRLTAESEYAEAVYRQEEAIYKKQSTTERKYLEALQNHKASTAALARSQNEVRDAEEALAARIGDEHALVAEVQAQLAEARLNRSYCKVVAPCAGRITNLQLREGAYAHVGEPVLTVIDADNWVVIANFREKALERMQRGQPALVAFHATPGRLYPATVRDIGSGVGQGQGIPSGLLPDVKDQTAWIPPEQRFQVRVVLDDPAGFTPRVGTTGSVSVYTNPHCELNPVTQTVHEILAWFYFL